METSSGTFLYGGHINHSVAAVKQELLNLFEVAFSVGWREGGAGWLAVDILAVKRGGEKKKASGRSSLRPRVCV